MGDEAATQLVLLRFSGDITIKARATRHQFLRRPPFNDLSIVHDHDLIADTLRLFHVMCGHQQGDPLSSQGS